MARKPSTVKPKDAPPEPARPDNTLCQAWSGTAEQQNPAGKDKGDVEEPEVATGD